MIIQRIYNAAIGATYDRAQITKDSKHVKKLDKIEFDCFNKKRATSGPSVHNPIKIAKSWRLAFLENMKRQKMIEDLNAPFEKTGVLSKTKQIVKDIAKTIRKV